jgi:hypothetical protein
MTPLIRLLADGKSYVPTPTGKRDNQGTLRCSRLSLPYAADCDVRFGLTPTLARHPAPIQVSFNRRLLFGSTVGQPSFDLFSSS